MKVSLSTSELIADFFVFGGGGAIRHVGIYLCVLVFRILDGLSYRQLFLENVKNI